MPSCRGSPTWSPDWPQRLPSTSETLKQTCALWGGESPQADLSALSPLIQSGRQTNNPLREGLQTNAQTVVRILDYYCRNCCVVLARSDKARQTCELSSSIRDADKIEILTTPEFLKFGTLEVLTWSQLGLHAKPCGILNTLDFYTPLLRRFDHAVGEQFLKPENRALVLARESPADLLQALEEWRPVRVEKWISRETG
jgi:hypothetical protein